MTTADLWPLIGIIIAVFGILQAALGLYMRYLIQQHTLTCPYPARFEKALGDLTRRVIADAEKVDRHLEAPGRHQG